MTPIRKGIPPILRGLLLTLICVSLDAKSFIYLGTYQQEILTIDGETYDIVKRTKLKTGQPKEMVLTADKKKLVILTNQFSGIEIFDLTKGEVIDSWNLTTGNKRVSPTSMAVDPTGTYLYTIGATYTKLIDRWDIGKTKISVIDLNQKKVVKEELFPKEEEVAEFESSLRVSPDGKSLYQFSQSVLVFDTGTLKVVKKIELTKPLFPGMGPINFAPEEDPHDDINSSTALFVTSDPFVHRGIYGIGKFNLNTREMQFSPLGTVIPGMGQGEGGMSNLRLTPDRKTGYAVAITGTEGDKTCQFWSIDIASKAVKDRQDFTCNSRFTFSNSFNGTDLLIFGAGFEIQVYDAATMKLRKTVNLGVDVTMSGMIIVPSEAIQTAAR